MKPLARYAVTTAALLSLAACAGGESTRRISTDSRRLQPVIMDGLNLTAMNQVFVKGFSEIKDRMIDDPDMDKVIAEGLTGFSKIDPEIVVAVESGHIKIRREHDDGIPPVTLGDVPVVTGGAARSTIPGWSRAVLTAIIAARQSSPLLHAAEAEDFYTVVFQAAIAKLDPYSHYSNRRDAVRTRLVRDGIIGLGIRMVAVDEGAQIQAIVGDGPGEKAGLEINDIITAADGRKLAKVPFAELRRILDGSKDTMVSLTVKRAGVEEPITVLAQRELIVPDTVTYKNLDGVAELKIRSFNQRTAAAVERAVEAVRAEEMQNKAGGKLKGIILDFRSDPGGLLDQAVEMSDLFLSEGSIISLDGRHPGAKQYYAASGQDIAPGVPIAIVVDGRTASAAEIVTAALQDQGRAVVVGTGTLGKGSVQTVVRLPNGGEMGLTWAHATTPRGAALNGLGILPDVCLAGLPGPTLDQALGFIAAGTNPTAEARHRWKLPKDDPQTHAALRALCPAEAHLDRDIDTDVARKLLAEPKLYAKLSTPEGPQTASKP
ncbi:MAG: PDZ domain-containing protein [Rhodospirillaceae bacterium]|nr:PDZ domain-containing protein [Rhodospirillaceae bacterium]